MKQRFQIMAPYLLLVMAGIFLLTWKIGQYPLVWYDEGTRFNLSRTLVETGNYATYSSDGYQPFNAWVIANPLDVFSTAGAIILFGKTVAFLRLAMLPFTMLGLITIAMLANRLFGKPAGWMAALTVFAAPPLLGTGFLLIGRQNLIENSALAMLVSSFLLWFHAWDTRKNTFSWLGGAFLGFGLISNFSMMLWVIPALTIIWVCRFIQNRKRSGREFVFLVAAVAVVAGWYVLSMILTPAVIRELNLATLVESATQQLFNGLSGKVLTTTATAMFGMMVIVSLITIMDLFQSQHNQWFASSDPWKRATLGVSVLFCAFWFYFFSIGWPRYAYAGWILALLLMGWWGYRLIEWMAKMVSNNNQKWSGKLPWAAVGLLVLLMFFVYGSPLVKVKGPVAAEQTAEFIDSEISPNARIETTETELFGLSDHWNYHYPSYQYILDASKQIFFDRQNPQISYNPVVADPDYLVTGALSDWVGLYWNSGIMSTEFVKIAEFPPYQVFERVRK